jgi:pseudaminic acid synthase
LTALANSILPLQKEGASMLESAIDRHFEIKTPRGARKIGLGHPAFVIAEVSANHQQDYEKAEAIIRISAEAGADAIKLQTYTPETMTIDCDSELFMVKSDNSKNWNTKLFDLYKKAYTPLEWHAPLKEITENLGMVFFSTPFDSSAVDLLTELNVELFKVASYELTDIPLLKKIAQTGRPVILSVGFGSLEEITEAIDTLRANGSKNIVVLHCVTNYSQQPDIGHSNLSTMLDLANRFNVAYGFSDNSGGIEIPLQAVMMGACMLEKHVIAKKGDGGLDSHFSICGEELKELVTAVRQAELIYGRPNYGPRNENEAYFKKFRRSLFVVEDIKKGEIVSVNNVRVIRPEGGLAPKFFDAVIGKKATVNIDRGTPLDWSLLD